MTFTLLTRAWEADDESSHVDYVEYIVKHDGIPPIGASNGIESHQPPLYYYLSATWQRLLGIPAFRPDPVPAHYANPYIPDHLVLNHDYTAAEHREAVEVHEIRLLSVALGLVTVFSTYVCARLVKMNQIVSLCSGLFVALLPRELVVTTAITNDALVIPLCSLALMCFLLAEHYRTNRRRRAQGISTVCMGLLLGFAAITKFNSLPVAVILLALTLFRVVTPHHATEPEAGVRTSDRHRIQAISFDPMQALYAGMAIVGFFLVSGWWFLRNKHLYGQYLATNVSENYLKYLGFFHPVPWNLDYFFHEVQRELWLSLWYLQPDLMLPVFMNTVLGLCALASVILAVWSLLIRPRGLTFDDRLTRLSLFAVIVGGVVAEILIIKSVGYSDARLAYVGLPALAIVLVAGSSSTGLRVPQGISRYLPFVWPAAMLATDLFVLARFLIPLGGL
jgi:hypothetical protein